MSAAVWRELARSSDVPGASYERGGVDLLQHHDEQN